MIDGQAGSAIAWRLNEESDDGAGNFSNSIGGTDCGVRGWFGRLRGQCRA